MKREAFLNGEYYHIYNRGVDKRDVFMEESDYYRFMESIIEFNRQDAIGSIFEKHLQEKRGRSPLWSADQKVVDIVAYCFNPNHFHLILKQNLENGISKFMLKLSSGYTSYFNRKYERTGSLFQGVFKSVHIDSNEYLLHLSTYVNNNYFIHGYGEKKWKFSSIGEYQQEKRSKISICDTRVILDQFNGANDYIDFMDKGADYFRDKKESEKVLFE